MHRDALEVVDNSLSALQSAIKEHAASRLADGATIVSAEDGNVTARRKLMGKVMLRSLGIYAQPKKAGEEVRVRLKPAEAREDALAAL